MVQIPAASNEKRGVRFAIKESDLETDADREAAAQANACLTKIVDLANRGDAASLVEYIKSFPASKRGTPPARRFIAVEISQCPLCSQGAISCALLSSSSRRADGPMRVLIEFDSRFGKSLATLTQARK
jgi:hypothetical protein